MIQVQLLIEKVIKRNTMHKIDRKIIKNTILNLLTADSFK